LRRNEGVPGGLRNRVLTRPVASQGNYADILIQAGNLHPQSSHWQPGFILLMSGFLYVPAYSFIKRGGKTGVSRDRTKAEAFLADLRAGLSDAALQEKYGLSRGKFYFYKAAALDIIAKETGNCGRLKRKISGKNFVKDIRSGMDGESLMSKYDLTPREVQSCFRQIIKSGLMGPLELGNRLAMTTSQVREAFVEMGKAVRELD